MLSFLRVRLLFPRPQTFLIPPCFFTCTMGHTRFSDCPVCSSTYITVPTSWLSSALTSSGVSQVLKCLVLTTTTASYRFCRRQLHGCGPALTSPPPWPHFSAGLLHLPFSLASFLLACLHLPSCAHIATTLLSKAFSVLGRSLQLLETLPLTVSPAAALSLLS